MTVPYTILGTSEKVNTGLIIYCEDRKVDRSAITTNTRTTVTEKKADLLPKHSHQCLYGAWS